MLLSIHIPKTAGTKFKSSIEAIYKDRIHFDYGTERDLTLARTCPDSILKDVVGFEKKVDCIHGHYHYPKYAGLFKNPRVVTTLRDPVSRVVSQYRHIAMHGDRDNKRHRYIMEGKLGIVQFSKFEAIGNAQSMYLDGLESSGIPVCVMFAEDMHRSLLRFLDFVNADKELAASILQASELQVNSRSGAALPESVQPITAESLSQVKDNCRKDLALYERMVNRFGADCREEK